jgi:hypothetical protein
MMFRHGRWRPIALALSVLNVGGAGFAIAANEGWHAATHVALALVFWFWAERLRQPTAPGPANLEARLDALETEMTEVRRELSEAQERLDFAERLLAQGMDAQRVEPER